MQKCEGHEEENQEGHKGLLSPHGGCHMVDCSLYANLRDIIAKLGFVLSAEYLNEDVKRTIMEL